MSVAIASSSRLHLAASDSPAFADVLVPVLACNLAYVAGGRSGTAQNQQRGNRRYKATIR